MIAYFVIFALCGVIVVQAVIYYHERLKLYDVLRVEKEKTIYNSRDKPRNDRNTREPQTAHEIALRKWRNGGGSE